MERPEITQDQIDALQAYAKANGHQWKHKLLDDWAAARIPGALQRLRNTHGPRWLMDYRLPRTTARKAS